MNGFLALGLISCSVTLLAGCWLGWQLLRQNGRMLLRLDELEERIEELEFGDRQSDVRNSRSEEDQSPVIRHVGSAKNCDGDYRASRFEDRSLARSRIKRDGLKAGTSAPSFRLPRLDGGELSLEELRGRRALLVFSDPHCGPCNALAPELEKFHRAHTNTSVLMISRGEPKENRAKIKEHGLTFPIVLQRQWEISRLYAMFATPLAYLIDESGIITHDVAVGVEQILALMAEAKGSPHHAEEAVLPG